jgi:hypothetical protein
VRGRRRLSHNGVGRVGLPRDGAGRVVSRQPGDGGMDRAEAAARYRQRLLSDPDLLADARRLLAGHDLVCWCPEDQPCHADVLLELANR